MLSWNEMTDTKYRKLSSVSLWSLKAVCEWESGVKGQKLAREGDEEEQRHIKERGSVSPGTPNILSNINMSPSIPPPSCKSEDPADSSGLMTPDSLRPPPASHRTWLEQTENHSAACLNEYLMGREYFCPWWIRTQYVCVLCVSRHGSCLLYSYFKENQRDFLLPIADKRLPK